MAAKFSGQTKSRRNDTVIDQFHRTHPKIEIKPKDELVVMGSPIG